MAPQRRIILAPGMAAPRPRFCHEFVRIAACRDHCHRHACHAPPSADPAGRSRGWSSFRSRVSPWRRAPGRWSRPSRPARSPRPARPSRRCPQQRVPLPGRKNRIPLEPRCARRVPCAIARSRPPQSRRARDRRVRNGPNATRISRFTCRPRWASTLRTSRFLPSRIAKASHTLAALLAFELRLDRPVMHAVDRDAVAQRSEFRLRSTRPWARTR